MKSTMKRMVLTGAAVAVMMSFAAPAMALPNVVDGGPGVIDPVVEPPPTPPPEKCEKLPKFCDIPFEDIPVLENPVVTEPPKHCVLRPKLCGESPFGEDPLGENPVIDPVEDEDPVVTDPPENEEPVTDPPDKEEGPDKDEQPNTDGGSGGGNSSGGSSGSATTGGGGSSGGSVSSASQTIDRGGNFVSSFLPYTLTTKMGDAGSAVKKNLPAPVAKSLPNTGGGWSFLILVGSALIAGGFAIRTLVRRKTSVTSTAQ